MRGVSRGDDFDIGSPSLELPHAAWPLWQPEAVELLHPGGRFENPEAAEGDRQKRAGGSSLGEAAIL